MVWGRVGGKLVNQEIRVPFESSGLQGKWLRLICTTPVLGIDKITPIYLSVYQGYCIFYALVPERIKLEKAGEFWLKW